MRRRCARYGMNPPLDAVKAVIKQFVVHHDGCSSADMCFSVLQNERGLSCHFLIDNDGTIYQTIDLALMAYHAAEWNIDSIGVEFCNRGDAKKEPNYYSSGRFGPKRDVKPCKINGNTILAFDYTPQQYDAFIAARVARCSALLPNLPAEFPQSSAGRAVVGHDAAVGVVLFSGYIGHYHLTNQKWDPGPFDFKDFCRKLRGSFCFPVFPRGEPKKPIEIARSCPSRPTVCKAGHDELYKAQRAARRRRLLPGRAVGRSRGCGTAAFTSPARRRQGRRAVFAPFPGRLVAARMGTSSRDRLDQLRAAAPRHDARHVEGPVLLALHAPRRRAAAPTSRAEWMTKSEAWKEAGKPGEVVLLDEPIEAGALIGHVGTAGPAELSQAADPRRVLLDRGAVHRRARLAVDAHRWHRGRPVLRRRRRSTTASTPTRTARSSSRSCRRSTRAGSGSQMHYLVTLHVSEWTAEPSWAEALRVPKDFKKFKPAEIDALVAEQITPGLWWDARGRGALPAADRRRRLPLSPGQRSSAGSTSSCSTRPRAPAPTPRSTRPTRRRCPRASPTTSATRTARRCARRRTSPRTRATRS